MKKYVVTILVLCVIEGMVLWLAEPGRVQSPLSPKTGPVSGNSLLNAQIVTVIEVQSDNEPAYLVCLEITDNESQPIPSAGRPHCPSVPDKVLSNVNLFPEPVTIALLALCGLLLGGRR